MQHFSKILFYFVLILLTPVLFAAPLEVVFSKGSLPYKKGDLIKEGTKLNLLRDDILIAKNRDFMIKASQPSSLTFVKLSIPIAIESSSGSLTINYFGLKNGKNVLNIRNKMASMGVRGTTFFTHSEEGKYMLVNVDSGVVAFKGDKSVESLEITKGSSTLTNLEKKTLKPRKFGFENFINYNFNPEKGSIEHESALYEKLEKVWENYKLEQEYQWKAKLDDDATKWEEFTKQNSGF